MELKVYSLKGTIFEGDATSVGLPAKDGVITALKGHIPLITILKEGEIKTPDQNIAIKGGFAEITKTKVVVLAN